MSDDPKPQIKAIFRDASQQRDIAMGFNGREFAERDAIKKQHKELLIREEKDYRADYTQRVAKVVKDLQRKDGARALDYKPANHLDDRFNGRAVQLRAEGIVRGNHAIAMARIKNAEHDAIDQLINRSQRRQQRGGDAKRAFGDARDRRQRPLGGDKESRRSQIKLLLNEAADRRDGFAARRQARSGNQGQAQQRNIERDRPPGPAR